MGNLPHLPMTENEPIYRDIRLLRNCITRMDLKSGLPYTSESERARLESVRALFASRIRDLRAQL